MAFVVPIAMAVGGGSAAAGAVTLAAAAATVGAGVASARNTRAAGKAHEIETKIAAQAEGDAARQREIERKRNLLRSISSRQAYAAAAGVKDNEGSQASLINLDIAEAGKDSVVDNTNTKVRQRALNFQGANARSGANSAARASLLDTAGRTAGIFL